MLYLIFSVLLSSALFICFKWFDLRRVQLLPAISGNYLACIVTGIVINGGFRTDGLEPSLLMACAGLGILFFAVFYSMGYAASRIGVGISSASAKLSLIIPVSYGALVLNEPFGYMRFAALLLAIPAVVLMSYKTGEKFSFKHLGLPLFIFAGSGFIDTALNILQKHLGLLSPAVAISLIFGAALLSSVLFSVSSGKPLFQEHRSLLYGLILGVPNYFSVHFMLMALRSGAFSSGQFYLINNSGVMLLSFVLAALLFSEQLNLYKIAGLLISVLSIYLVLFG